MRRSSREGPCQAETGWPLGKMVVVVGGVFHSIRVLHSKAFAAIVAALAVVIAAVLCVCTLC